MASADIGSAMSAPRREGAAKALSSTLRSTRGHKGLGSTQRTTQSGTKSLRNTLRSTRAAAQPENPFALPANDELLTARELAKAEQKELRATLRQLPVHERSTVLQRPPAKALVADIDDELAAEQALEDKTLTPAEKDELTKQLDLLAIETRDRRIEREQLSEYVQTRREVFLLKFSLDVKRAEIQKLEEQAHQEEAKLNEAERWLEADAAKFDQFLRDNDRAAVSAIKDAEEATARKQDKASEIKRLQAEIMAVGSEVTKQEDQISELRSYRLFLDSLSPAAWQSEQELKQRQVLTALRSRQASAASEAAASARPAGRRRSSVGTARRRRRSSSVSRRERAASVTGRNSVAEIRQQQEQQQETALQRFELVDLELEPSLYFQEPSELVNILESLEEENLSLITNGQDSEEHLQDLSDRFRAERQVLQQERTGMENQLSDLEAQIERERETVVMLKERCQYFSAATVEDQEAELGRLDDKVSEVYRACIGQNEAGISTLQMLTNIENKVEELLEAMSSMPPDRLAAAEKIKDKERRQRLREEKLQEQKRQQELRVRRALQRAQEAPREVTGRKLMYRSQPPPRKRTDHNGQNPKAQSAEEEEMRLFFQ